MSSLFAKAGIAALMALGAVSAVASTASAGDLPMKVREVRYDPHAARTCSPVLAVQKARYDGMRYAHIADMTARRVVVEGRTHRGPDRIVFANVPGCPRWHRGEFHVQ
jgi:hypothetical protein